MNRTPDDTSDQEHAFDVIVVGAGFAGLYLLHELRGLGFSVRVFEAGSGVGGTWYWNRYPGARCDAESLAYSFSFSPELEQDWEWSERYATQPEILRYLEHVAERFDLLRDIRFESRVLRAHFDDERGDWRIETDRGERARARHLILATGCLSVPQEPAIPGLETFAGPRYFTSRWPHEPVDFRGLRVGVIGTGSSAVQSIPLIASEARHLTVFQRTAAYSVPAANRKLDPQFVSGFKRNYRSHRENHRQGIGAGFGDLRVDPHPSEPAFMTAAGQSPEALRAALEAYWDVGGARYLFSIADILANEASNAIAAEFVREKIRGIVRDPKTAELLCPTKYPIGTKRICVDIGYYETFNRANVSLVDIDRFPIERITASGVELEVGEGGSEGSESAARPPRVHELDALVLATGFDAVTGAMLRIDLRGAGGVRLADKWAEGPRTYLGLAIAGFPNLFMITGPGSPSVLSNMVVSIEQHVEWITACLGSLRRAGQTRIEADEEAESRWTTHVGEVASQTLYPRAGSWYLGANVPGKPRVFMAYLGGVGNYRQLCDGIAARGYEGFRISA